MGANRYRPNLVAQMMLESHVVSPSAVGSRLGEQTQNQSIRARSAHTLTALAVAIFSMLIFLPPVLSEATYGNDYRDHIRFATDLLKTGHLMTPHFLFHVLLNGMVNAFGSVSTTNLAAFIGVLSYGVVGVTLYLMLLPAFWAFASRWTALAAGLTTLCIIMLGPVNLFSLNSTSLLAPNGAYLGYLAPDSFHNPTTTLMRPFALLLFLVSLRVFIPGRRASLPLIAAAVALSVLGPLAKPNFTICLLPFLCLMSGYALLRRGSLNWRLLVFGIAIPSVMVLMWQYFSTYSSGSGNPDVTSHVILAPLRVYDTYASNLLGHFLASILFPLSVTLLFWKNAKRDPQLLYAWGLFIVGCLYSYLLAEDGPRINDGNFTWSGQITTFILLASCMLFFIRQLKAQSKCASGWRNDLHQAALGSGWLQMSLSRYAVIVCAVALALHLAGGLFLYGLAIAQPW